MQNDDLVYSAYERCTCGAGLAYSKNSDPQRAAWSCSATLLGTADPNKRHLHDRPAMFYPTIAEHERVAYGATTRPQPAEKGGERGIMLHQHNSSAIGDEKGGEP